MNHSEPVQMVSVFEISLLNVALFTLGDILIVSKSVVRGGSRGGA